MIEYTIIVCTSKRQNITKYSTILYSNEICQKLSNYGTGLNIIFSRNSDGNARVPII